MALIAIRELDEVTTVYTGWDAGVATIDETAKQQSTNAAMLHAIEQMTAELLDIEVISGERVREIIKENGGTVFEDEDLHSEAIVEETNTEAEDISNENKDNNI